MQMPYIREALQKKAGKHCVLCLIQLSTLIPAIFTREFLNISWYLFTMITEVFGVRGVFGNLLVHPKLLAEQFDEAGTASVSVTFAGKQFHVTYRNTDRKDYGSYHIAAADCDKTAIEIAEDSHIMISREFINNLSSDLHEITVTLA